MKKYKELLPQLISLLLLVGLTIALSEIAYQRMIKSSSENCWEELSLVHDTRRQEIGTRLTNSTIMLDLAADASMVNVDFEDHETVLAYLASVQKETLFDRIDVIFPDGTILVQCGDLVADRGEKMYHELLAMGAHLSPRVADFHTGKECIHAFSPVYNAAGEPIAILGGTIYCATLAENFTSVHYGADAQLFLVDLRDGNFVLDKWHESPGSIYDMRVYADPTEGTGGDFIGEIMAGNTGKVPYKSQLYGKTSYTVYGKVPGTSYSLVVVVQEDALFADVNEMRERLSLVGIVEVILLLLFAGWLYIIMRRSARSEYRAKQAELALLQQKEQELENQYAAAAERQEFLETLAVNLPGGYHRCTTEDNFKLSFVSNSFTQVTGYTMAQIQEELGGQYLSLVVPEDRAYFMSLAPQLERDGVIQCFYRIRRRDGSIRWVKDHTQYVELENERYYQCALMDISDQIEEIEHAKQQAEASSQAKSTFLFNISHDIRTPMNAIKGFSRIIEENADDPALVKKTVAKINQAGESLMMLMNDVLDISRIERGKEEVNLRPMNLYEHGRNLYEMFSADMKAAGLDFRADGDALHDDVYCDELKLTRIMMNMLSNARKFTPAGGQVTFGGVRLHRDEHACTYRFFVRDTGIGMSPEFQKRAFEQFERERTSTESGVAGSGLGLAIIKMMVDLLGGTVEIRSELGKGTEITVTLTLQLADQEPSRQASAPEKAVLDLTGKRVLLVEDNDFNREIARYILESMQLIVEEAENGAVCLEKLMSAPAVHYDLILMDIQMPVMDGYTATIEIRNLKDQQRANIPIVAMTANAFEEDRKKCIEAGMNSHIGKPINAEALMQELSNVFH